MVEWSRLTLALAALVRAERAGPTTDEELLEIEVAVQDMDQHLPGSSWMVILVERLASGRLTDALVTVPHEGPERENHLAQILVAAGARIPELRWVDYGEGIEHTFLRLGVRFFLSREAKAPFYAIRPAESSGELDTWLGEQYVPRSGGES